MSTSPGTNFIGVHGLFSHWSGEEDVARISGINPGIIKVVLVDTKTPGYVIELARALPKAKFEFRHHPSSELYGSRGMMKFSAHLVESVEISSSNVSDSEKIVNYFSVVPWKRLPESRQSYHLYALDTPQKVSDVAKYQAQIAYEIVNNAVASGLKEDQIAGVEGINEPQYWSTEAPDIVTDLECQRMLILHGYNIGAWLYQSGVGWPGNGGVTDAPPNYAFMKPAVQMMNPKKDVLCGHEYYANHIQGSAENWGWWCGRLMRCGFDVPLAITECGIDTGVIGQWYGGWHDLPGSNMDSKATLYSQQLIDLAYKYINDSLKITNSRFVTMTPFTFDISSPEWEKFNIRDQVFLEKFVPMSKNNPFLFQGTGQAPVVVPPVVVPPVVVPPVGGTMTDEDIRRDVWVNTLKIPYDKTKALTKFAEANNLGAPLSDEIRKPDAGIVYQPFMGGIVICKIGDWGNVRKISY